MREEHSGENTERAQTRHLLVGTGGDGGPPAELIQLLDRRRTVSSVGCLLSESRPDRWRRTFQRLGSDTEIVTGLLGDGIRGPASADGSGGETTSQVAEERRLPAADLVAIGEFLLEVLGEWRRDRAGVEGRRAVVFDSLTPLLAAHSLETVFEFLLIVSRKLRRDGVDLYVCVDETTLDTVSVRTLAGAVDESVSLGIA